MKKNKKYTFKEFREFLNEKCWNEKEYGNGKYDKKIYDWFEGVVHKGEVLKLIDKRIDELT